MLCAPVEGILEAKDGSVTVVSIGKTIVVTVMRGVYDRWSLARVTKEEIREVCDETMKEAA